MNQSGEQRCAHCGQTHRQGLAYCADIAGKELAMCCAGCLAIARLIANASKNKNADKHSLS